MASFKGNEKIVLQTWDKLNYQFNVTSCSTSAANDGYLPFGRTVSSVTVSGYAENKSTPANDLINSTPTVQVYPSQYKNIITVPLKYPSSSGDGRYSLTFYMTLDNGNKSEADFDRIEAGNI